MLTRRAAAVRSAWPALVGAAACCWALLAGGVCHAAAPSTFGTVVGSALLCMDDIDNHYFYAYLTTAFGPAYKHEGGAYWFKAPANLWNTTISEVFVSDDTSPLKFIGAVADTTPDKVADAILAASGIRYQTKDASKFPMRTSRLGSTIVFFQKKAKVYCDKFKPLPPPPQ